MTRTPRQRAIDLAANAYIQEAGRLYGYNGNVQTEEPAEARAFDVVAETLGSAGTDVDDLTERQVAGYIRDVLRVARRDFRNAGTRRYFAICAAEGRAHRAAGTVWRRANRKG